MNSRTTSITAKSSVSSFVEIDVGKLKQNARLLSQRAGTAVKTMAVVKADAYGHNASIVARTLADCISALGVASVEEAVSLRNAGIILPILVFAPVREDNAADYQTYNLIAVVGSFRELSLIQPSTSFYLEFDTGMGRLGFAPEDWQAIKQILDKTRQDAWGIMTHFATADTAASPKVAAQLQRFDLLLEEMGEWRRGKTIHASNSGGLMYYPEAAYSMVRFGLALYGFAPDTADRTSGLQPVLSWKSSVVSCKRIKAGKSVSYGASWTAPTDGWLITIPVGYADGIRRGLSNNIQMRVGGQLLQQVGNVTMDYTMLYSNDPVAIGEDVVILGHGAMQASDWALLLNTIPYEILCGIHPKIERRPVSV